MWKEVMKIQTKIVKIQNWQTGLSTPWTCDEHQQHIQDFRKAGDMILFTH